MAANNLESRLVVVSSENAPVVQSLQKRWLLTTSEVQAARMNGNSRFLLMERDTEPQIIGPHRLRGKDILGGNAVAYAIEDGDVVLYIMNQPNNPFDTGNISKILNGYVQVLSPDESQKLRIRGRRDSSTEVARFVILEYPTATSLPGHNTNYNFFEILGDGSQANVAEMLLFSHLQGLNYPDADFQAYNHSDKTRIGLFRRREVESYLRGTQRGQMAASFIQLKGMNHGFDVYLGSPACGYVVAQIPVREWHKWLAQNTPKI
ncbi:hypothetical protein HYX06_02740 [Candidatus Woesearchaeota archaeon]|nr:hypothetical protein [Candidatus Woesearchaeota archaeon]